MSAEEEIGSVAEEAAKLFGALGGVLGEESAASGHGPGAHEQPSECRFCPLCRLIRLLEEASPQAREQMSSAVVSLVDAVSGLLAAAGTARAEAAEADPSARGADDRGRPRGAASDPVEHIDLADQGDWDDGDRDEPEWKDLG